MEQTRRSWGTGVAVHVLDLSVRTDSVLAAAVPLTCHGAFKKVLILGLLGRPPTSEKDIVMPIEAELAESNLYETIQNSD